MTAAPWRAKALSASDLPAPIPPVTATATGLRLGLVAAWLVGLGFGNSLSLIGLGLRARLELLWLGGSFGPDRSFGLRRRLELGRLLGLIREDLLGEPEGRCLALSVAVDALQRQGKASPL